MKILFYAPHSAIWVHAFPEALVAESLAKAGHEIVYVTCGKLFSRHCVAMSAAAVGIRSPQQMKDAICNACNARKQLIRSAFGFKGYDLADVVQDEDRQRATEVVGTVSKANYLSLTVEHLQIGRIALYEFLLERKKGSLDLDEQEWSDYLVQLENTLLACFAARRTLKREQPDRVVVYNSLYSVNRVLCELAEQLSIPTYFLHAGMNFSNRLQTLLLGRRNGFSFYEELLKAWPRFRSLACEPTAMGEITNHFMMLFEGSSPFGYSSAIGVGGPAIRARYGIGPEQRILLATMSSYDERLAAEATGAIAPPRDLTFGDQTEWIAALVQYVSSRRDLFLVIRVHPREFPNRREGVTSDHARLLQAVLRNLPENACVNWPQDKVSLFELAGEASVILNAWSAAGKELGLLGIPVVLYAPSLVAYPPDLNFSATTKDSYFLAIDQALKAGWSAERSRMTYRWLALEYGYGLISIADAYTPPEMQRLSLAGRVLRRLARALNPLYFEQRDCARRPERLLAASDIEEILVRMHPTPCSLATRGARAASAVAATEEHALRVQLGRMANRIFRGNKNPSLLQRHINAHLEAPAPVQL